MGGGLAAVFSSSSFVQLFTVLCIIFMSRLLTVGVTVFWAAVLRIWNNQPDSVIFAE